MNNPLLKKKIFLYISEFISGVSVMGIEIAANRLLAPYLSSSQVVLTIITGIVLIAMSIGNILGGRLADKKKNIKYLYIMMLISGTYVCIIPFIGKYVIALFAGLFALIASRALIILTTIFSCLILLVPPLLILGMVTPSLIKYSLGEENANTGKVIGYLEALNTIGSILGTFLPTFVTIPFIGTMVTFVIFGSLLITVALIFIITDMVIRIKNGEYKTGKIVTKTSLLVLAITISITGAFLGSRTKFVFADTSGIQESESMYNYLKIEDKGNRIEFSTNVFFGVQSTIKKDFSLTGMYYDYALSAPLMTGIMKKDTKKLDVLILGNGTGTYATMLEHYYPEYDLNITGVEIDQEIINLSYKYFYMSDNINAVCDDGRSYLSRDKNKYDVIMVDAYSSIAQPFQMTTVEFFTSVNEHLKSDGVVVMNINMISKDSDSINNALSDTLMSIIPNTYKYETGTNMLVFASNNDMFMENIKDLSDINSSLMFVSDSVYSRSIKHNDTGIRLYDTSADVEIRSMYAVSGIIESEVGYYKKILEEKGLKGLIDYLLS